MYYSPQSLKQPQLKSSELVILKSLALGLGCDTIKNLLELSEEEFKKKLNSLYTKLQVCNSYTAVGVAFKKGILREKEIIIEEESNSFLAKHLYRIQKLSSKFYEFRLVHDNNLTDTGSPNYVRINNFGHRKTGWHTHNPIKVKVNSIGELSFENEQEKFIKMQKSYV